MSDLCGLTTFTVTEQLGPLGTVAKLPADYREAAFDFACWLADGEFVTSLDQHGIIASPQVPQYTCLDSTSASASAASYGSWSIAFTCGSATPSPVPAPPAPPVVDVTPLLVIDTHIVSGGKQAVVLVGEGTPGLTYGISFLATVSPTQRRKAVDLLVCVASPMVDFGTLPTPPPPPPYQFVTGNIALPVGTIGTVFVNNTSNAGITITLPPLPDINQTLTIKDILGNASTYHITIVATGYTIDGQPNLIIAFNYGWSELTFTGTQWVQV